MPLNQTLLTGINVDVNNAYEMSTRNPHKLVPFGKTAPTCLHEE